MQIEFKNVSYTYAGGSVFEQEAITDVSLGIERGDFVGIIGRTGCGKSTLVKLMGGLLVPDSGTVLFNGEDINGRRYDRKTLRSKLGMVFQFPEYQLFGSTVEKDVGFALKGSGKSREEAVSCIRSALETVGFDYDDVKDKSPMGFSGGEKRRIAIAGALVHNPEVLILDEPIAGLDPLGRQSFLSLLDKLNASGVTIIMISHNSDALCEHAKRIILMKDGRIGKDGCVCSIFSNTELLTSNGLNAGQVGEITGLLRQRGIDVPHGIITYTQLLDYIVSAGGRFSS